MIAISFGLCAAFAWGIHDILIRYISQKLGILVSLFSVLVFGALAQSFLAGVLGTPSDLSQDGLGLSLAAGVAFSFACIGHYNAFQRGPVRLVAPIIGCYPVLAFAFAAANDKAMSPLQWFSLAVLIFGIALVARSSDKQVEDASYSINKTLFYCVMAMVGFAITFELGQRASAVGDPLYSSLITRTTTIAIIGALLINQNRKSGNKFVRLEPRALVVLAFMGVLDAIALGLVLSAGTLQSPELTSAASSIFGLITVVLGWMFMREKVNIIQWAGIAAVFSAIAYLASS